MSIALLAGLADAFKPQDEPQGWPEEAHRIRPSDRDTRSPENIAARQAKQQAKLARRAAKAKRDAQPGGSDQPQGGV